jgi:hypothetical protein
MRIISLLALLGLVAAPLDAQTANRSGGGPGLQGTWQLEKGKVKADGPKTVVIRADSSASWGKETVRWRLKGDKIMIALGGEWETYKLKLKTDRLTLSGGDLTEEVTLRRIGPPTERPDSVPVPPDPDTVTK